MVARERRETAESSRQHEVSSFLRGESADVVVSAVDCSLNGGLLHVPTGDKSRVSTSVGIHAMRASPRDSNRYPLRAEVKRRRSYALHKKSTPERFSGDHSWCDVAIKCNVCNPSKAMTVFVKPERQEIVLENVIVEQASSNSMADTQGEKNINSTIVASVTKYIPNFLEALRESQETSSRLDQLHKIFRPHDVGSGEVDKEAVKEFVGGGNPCKVMEKYHDADEMLTEINQLKGKYDRAIASGSTMRMATVSIYGVLAVGSFILCIKPGPSASLFIPPVVVVVAAGNAWEAYRKAREDDIKEKKKGIPKTRELFSLCKVIQKNHGLVSSEYEKFVQLIGQYKVQSVLDNWDGEAKKGNDLMQRKERTMHVAEEAKKLKIKVDNLKDDMERVKYLVSEMEADPSVSDVMEDLAR